MVAPQAPRVLMLALLLVSGGEATFLNASRGDGALSIASRSALRRYTYEATPGYCLDLCGTDLMDWWSMSSDTPQTYETYAANCDADDDCIGFGDHYTYDRYYYISRLSTNPNVASCSLGVGLSTGNGAGLNTCYKKVIPAASATGDPHLTNIHGERFDLYQPGVHELLKVPRGAKPQDALLLLEADARRLGAACADMYFQAATISGAWTNQTGDLRFSAQSDAPRRSMSWTRFGTVELKVVSGRTAEGVDYLNVFAKHLDRAGYPIGGLLGEDDHSLVSSPGPECKKRVALRGFLHGYASAL